MEKKLRDAFCVLGLLCLTGQAKSQKKDSTSVKGLDIQEVVITAMGVKKEVKKLGYDVTEVKGDVELTQQPL